MKRDKIPRLHRRILRGKRRGERGKQSRQLRADTTSQKNMLVRKTRKRGKSICICRVLLRRWIIEEHVTCRRFIWLENCLSPSRFMSSPRAPSLSPSPLCGNTSKKYSVSLHLLKRGTAPNPGTTKF